MARSIPKVRDSYLQQHDLAEPSLDRIALGSAEWYAWLGQHRTFSFETSTNTFTAHKEQRTGGWYWYAYRRRQGKLHTAYLGKSEDLTLERLNAVEAELARIESSRDLREAGNDVVQVQHASIIALPTPSSFVPRTRSEAARKQNLPIQPTPLVGREQDVAAICMLLNQPEIRELTLLGVGGVGKTRLAIEVATQMQPYFADGVCFVSLAAISDPELVFPTIANILGIQEIGTRSIIEQMKVALHDKQFLLMLDNFEHVVRAASQVEELLMASPFLKIVVTSRSVLHLQIEHLFPVSPLALPNLAGLPEREALVQNAAVALFLQRARALQPTFQITVANAPTIAEICVRLDGLPLAIELAAARIRLLPPQALLARLSQRFQVLTGGAQTLPERQQTLWNTITWSYQLLTPQEQRLFRLLSVFAGGCTLEALESMCTQEDRPALLEIVASLLDKSLILQIEQGTDEPRLSMLETIREYGLHCLQECGEWECSQRTHAEYYIALGEQGMLQLKGGQTARWMTALHREEGNLRAALQYLIAHKETELALRLSQDLSWYWMMRGFGSEPLRWLEEALRLPHAGEPTVGRARALSSAGLFKAMQGKHTTGRALLEESVALFQGMEDNRGYAEALIFLGTVYELQQDLTAARALQEQTVLFCREMGDKWFLAWALNDLAETIDLQGDAVTARALLEEALTLYRELGRPWGLSRPLEQLAWIALRSGNYIRAETLVQEAMTINRETSDTYHLLYDLLMLGHLARLQGNGGLAVTFAQQALAIAHQLGNQWSIIDALSNLAAIARYWQEYAEALTLAQEGMSVAQASGNPQYVAQVLCIFGDVAREQGQHTQAANHYREALSSTLMLVEKERAGWAILGIARVAKAAGHYKHAAHLLGAMEARLPVRFYLDPVRWAEYEHDLAKIRARLGEEAYVVAVAEGHAMLPEQLLVIAEQVVQATLPQPVSIKPEPPGSRKPLAFPNDLTARKVEVLRLMAQGLTNPEIAEQLVLSPHTVTSHVSSILSKLGVHSRSAAVRFAFEHHLA